VSKFIGRYGFRILVFLALLGLFQKFAWVLALWAYFWVLIRWPAETAQWTIIALALWGLEKLARLPIAYAIIFGVAVIAVVAMIKFSRIRKARAQAVRMPTLIETDVGAG